MDAKGVAYEVRTLSGAELRLELLKKVGEEASALPTTTNREELVGELADVLDVVDEIRRLEHIADDEIRTAQATNAQKKGGFLKKIFLVWSADTGYKTNERRNT